MKKINLKMAATVMICGAFLLSSCVGSFGLHSKLVNWNQSIGNKFVNELVYLACNIIPVYGVCYLADAVVINSIEFWSGSNPMASVGDIKKVKGENGDYKEGFVAQLNTAKVCDTGEKGCFWDGIPKQLSGGAHSNSYDGYKYTVRTTDGMSFNYSTTDCGGKGLSAERLAKCMGRFVVDVNGDKGPNRFGYDMFFFALIKGEGVIPAGADDGSSDCKKGGTGATCAAKVINEKKIDIK